MAQVYILFSKLMFFAVTVEHYFENTVVELV